MKRFALLVALLMWPALAMAAFDSQTLPDSRQEALAREIMTEVRCLVCQGESIADSNADYAADLRRLVRERVAAGENAQEVKAYLVSRYGDWVLLQPPVKPETYLLWAAPVLFLGLGLLLVWRIFRKSKPKEGA